MSKHTGSQGHVPKMTSKSCHFVGNKSYRGDMHVGIHSGEAPVVGNQPQENRTSSFEKLSKSTH